MVWFAGSVVSDLNSVLELKNSMITSVQKKKSQKNLKDLNIRKELADERVEWLRAIMPRKIQLQRVRFICGGQAL